MKFAQAMFLVPKPEGKIRPIIDYSPWTQYIIAPRFSLLSAGSVIRRIPLGNLMIEVDLGSGFHLIPLAKSSYNHNGISYKGTKYSHHQTPHGPRSCTLSISEVRRGCTGWGKSCLEYRWHRLLGRLAAALSLTRRSAIGLRHDRGHGHHNKFLKICSNPYYYTLIFGFLN